MQQITDGMIEIKVDVIGPSADENAMTMFNFAYDIEEFLIELQGRADYKGVAVNGDTTFEEFGTDDYDC